jgi:pyrimidine operon attenuation protein/uracil phosphoribosyltransferase
VSALSTSSVAVMTGADVHRALSRIAHEIVEKNHGSDNLVMVGLQRGGVWIAQALAYGASRCH